VDVAKSVEFAIASSTSSLMLSAMMLPLSCANGLVLSFPFVVAVTMVDVTVVFVMDVAKLELPS